MRRRAFGDCGGGGGRIFPKEGGKKQAQKNSTEISSESFLSDILHCVCFRVRVLEVCKRLQTLANICAVLRDEINVAPVFWGHAF